MQISDERRKQIKDIYENGTNFTNELTYEERVLIFNHIINEKPVPIDKVQKLFLKEELIYLFNNLNFLEIETLKDYFIYPDILNEYNSINGSMEDYIQFIDKIDNPNMKFIMNLDLLCKGLVNPQNIIKYLKHIGIDDREIFLKNTLKYFNKKRISYPATEFIKYFNLLKENEQSELFKYILNKNMIDNEYLEKIILCLSIDKKEEIIDFILENSNSNKFIKTYNLAEIILNEEFENGKRLILKYCVYNKNFNYKGVINAINNEDTKFRYIDFILDIYSEEDFTYKFNIVNSLITRDLNFGKKLASGNKIYHNIDKLYAIKYNLNESNLDSMINKFSYNLIPYLENDNIRKLINLHEPDFLKIVNLFDNCSLTKDNLNDMCNALIQRKFRITNHDDYEIFSYMENIINSNDDDANYQIEESLVKISKVVNVNNYLVTNGLNLESFIMGLLNANSKCITILHDITQEYIKIKRNEYNKDNLESFMLKLNLIKTMDKSDFKIGIYRFINIDNIVERIKLLPKSILNSKECELIDNRILLNKLLAFKKQMTKSMQFTPIIKENIKVLEGLLNKLYEYDYNTIAKYFNPDYDVKYNFVPYKVDLDFLLNILNSLNIDEIKDTILDNDKLYDKLRKLLDKYKLLGWGHTFINIEDDIDMLFNEGTIASLISNFSQINSVTSNNPTVTEYIDLANCYDQDSLIYSKLLGRENYRLISSNTGKNKSNTTRKFRLENIPKLIRMMYNKDINNIPSIDDTFDTLNAKKVHVVLGNNTSTMNLTYGERTGACLRIGGAFNDLFEFCLKDKRGFHIRFESPSGDFISRVSGIRNGNTVFLNELRNSVNKDYSDDEIIKVLSDVSKYLINITKSSKNPISNVVISSDLALNDYDNKTVSTELDKEKDPFLGLNFNINKKGRMIILATANKDNTLVPYDFYDVEDEYKPVRDKVKISTNQMEAIEYYDKIQILDKILNGVELEDIEYESKNLIYSVMGEDYCISIDDEMNIHKKILTKSIGKEETMIEMENSLKYIQEYVEMKKYSGGKNEKVW